jgi:hypothetical protein
MKIAPKDIRAAGVDPKAWTRYVRNPYGSFHGIAKRIAAQPVQDGPFAGYTLNLRDPHSGTAVIRVGDEVGRYVWIESGYRYGKPYGYLAWESWAESNGSSLYQSMNRERAAGRSRHE